MGCLFRNRFRHPAEFYSYNMTISLRLTRGCQARLTSQLLHNLSLEVQTVQCMIKCYAVFCQGIPTTRRLASDIATIGTFFTPLVMMLFGLNSNPSPSQRQLDSIQFRKKGREMEGSASALQQRRSIKFKPELVF